MRVLRPVAELSSGEDDMDNNLDFTWLLNYSDFPVIDDCDLVEELEPTVEEDKLFSAPEDCESD